MLAHIAGFPLEETALSLGPVIAAAAGIAGLKLRERAVRRRVRGQAPVTAPASMRVPRR